MKWLAVPAFWVLLAVVHTWPLATAPGTLSRNDNGDAMLNEWILAWVAHQLPRAPAHLFDANIFYPEPDTLAYSEPLIVPALLGAPVRWFGGSPVLHHNIVLLLGYALMAVAGYVLAREWTGSRAAGLLTGSAFAFNTHTLTRLAHVQGVHAWGLPLALLSTDRLMASARIRDAIWLAVWMAAMAYTSGYLAVFGAVLVAVAVISRLPWWWRRAPLVLSRLAISVVVAGLAVLPIYLPYRRVAIEQGLVRTLDLVDLYSLPLKAYITSAGRLHYWLWSEPFFEDALDPFFPGAVVLCLALAGIVWGLRGRGMEDRHRVLMRERVAMLVAIAAAGVILSMGTRTPIYGWLFEIFPPLQGLRAAARFGILFLLGMAALAGMALAMLLARLSAGRARALAAIAIVLVNIEALRAPFGYTRFEGIPPVYTHLAETLAPVVLVEIPFYEPDLAFLNAEYVLNSTAHFRPLMNGYSGYTPESYAEHADAFASFPDAPALREMRRARVTHVMVHSDRLDGSPERKAAFLDRVAASPGLEIVAVGGNGITLYRLR